MPYCPKTSSQGQVSLSSSLKFTTLLSLSLQLPNKSLKDARFR